MRKLLLMMTAVLSAGFAFAQNVQVTGIATAADDGSPMPAVTVSVQGTSIGTTTDMDGAYSISAPSNGTLLFSFVGYDDAIVPVNGRRVINVTLNPGSIEVDEVLITAYGTSTKGTFTGSAAVVDSRKIEQRTVSNVSNALAGAMAGVQIQNNNGQPGESSKILIRGVGSINSGTSPLIVVDGVPFDGDLSSINTADIENLTVLKDAASTALYGARGANGIIMVTTKTGKSSKAVVNIDARYGVNSRGIKNYDVLTDPAEYMKGVYTALKNQRIAAGSAEDAAGTWANGRVFTSTGTGYQIYTIPSGETLFLADGTMNPNATLGYSDGTYYYTPDNWSNEIFSNNARKELNASVSAGDDNFNYFISYGNLDDQGVITGSGFERNTVRVNSEYQASKWLRVGGNVSYSNSKSYYPGEQTNTASSGNAFFLANSIAPVYPIYVRDAQGNIIYDDVYKKPVYDYGDGVSTKQKRKYMQIANPAGDLAYNKTEYLMDIFHGNWFAKITPLRGLSFTARYGLDIDNTRYNDLGNARYGQSANYGGTAYQYAERTSGFDQQYVANYNVVLDGKHAIDLTAGYEGYELNITRVEASGVNLYNPDQYYVSNAIDQKNGYGSADNYSTQGYFGRLNYTFNEKYIASVSYRRDASSRFAPENRWGNFYSASAAWVLSNEDFLSQASWLDLLKFKASFGQQGNDQFIKNDEANYYPYMDQYKMTGANGVFATTLAFKGNPDITWETTTSYNAGFDFAMFDGKLQGSIEYFGRKSSDMLYFKPVNPSLGYAELPMNVGSLMNSGVELDVTYTPIKTKKVQWDINFNATSVKNKIIKLHPDLGGRLEDGTRIYEEGESMYRLYLVKYAGVDPTNGKALYWAKNAQGEEYKTDDWTAANETNKTATKDLMPKVYGGFGTTLQAYGFDISAQFSYQLGGYIRDHGYQLLMHGGSSSDMGRNWSTDIRNAWTPENTDTDVPRLCTSDKYTNSTSDRFLTSSNYLSINNITVGYTFPSTLTSKFLVSKMRVYFTADNLALFSARNGLDPRQSFTTATTSRYTAIKTLSGGVSLTF